MSANSELVKTILSSGVDLPADELNKSKHNGNNMVAGQLALILAKYPMCDLHAENGLLLVVDHRGDIVEQIDFNEDMELVK